MNLTFRNAIEADIPGIVNLLFDDDIGATREDISVPLNTRYKKAFNRIDKDPNNELIIVENNGELSGILQLTFIPYMTHIGSWRCLIEGVRIHKNHRGRGQGRESIQWAIARAKQKQCSMVQLTSDKRRPGALKFYESLGFQASHEGFKLKL